MVLPDRCLVVYSIQWRTPAWIGAPCRGWWSDCAVARRQRRTNTSTRRDILARAPGFSRLRHARLAVHYCTAATVPRRVRGKQPELDSTARLRSSPPPPPAIPPCWPELQNLCPTPT